MSWMIVVDVVDANDAGSGRKQNGVLYACLSFCGILQASPYI